MLSLYQIPSESRLGDRAAPDRAWEVQIESLLKDYYTSIRNQRLPMNSADAGSGESVKQGRGGSTSNTTGRHSGSVSLDQYGDRGTSVISSHGRPSDAFGNPFSANVSPSIGFTGVLNTAKQREESNRPNTASTHTSSSQRATSSSGQQVPPAPEAPLRLVDEALELAGAPWAKEGLLSHKVEAVGKDEKKSRGSERGWTDCFGVVGKGTLRLFSFAIAGKTSSVRRKQPPARPGRAPAVVVGGGNWTDNAEQIASFPLRHTLAIPYAAAPAGASMASSAPARPGAGAYSRTRAHVLVLRLPSGARHLFSVGTAEILDEWTSTCNYWAARLSTAPLAGAVSNAEYGWSEALLEAAMAWGGFAGSLNGRPATGPGAGVQARVKFPGDKAQLAEWTPPAPAFAGGGGGGGATPAEADQAGAVAAYILELEAQQAQHAHVRETMLLAFSPRHANAARALANWERRRVYLGHEAAKFRAYAAALAEAGVRGVEVRRRAVEEEVARVDGKGSVGAGVDGLGSK